MSNVTITTENKAANIPYLITDKTTEQEYLDNVFSLGVGSVFRIDERSVRYETVQDRISRYTPDALKFFDVIYIQPGNLLYSMYGAGHCVVITKVPRV